MNKKFSILSQMFFVWLLPSVVQELLLADFFPIYMAIHAFPCFKGGGHFPKGTRSRECPFSSCRLEPQTLLVYIVDHIAADNRLLWNHCTCKFSWSRENPQLLLSNWKYFEQIPHHMPEVAIRLQKTLGLRPAALPTSQLFSCAKREKVQIGRLCV